MKQICTEHQKYIGKITKNMTSLLQEMFCDTEHFTCFCYKQFDACHELFCLCLNTTHITSLFFYLLIFVMIQLVMQQNDVHFRYDTCCDFFGIVVSCADMCLVVLMLRSILTKVITIFIVIVIIVFDIRLFSSNPTNVFQFGLLQFLCSFINAFTVILNLMIQNSIIKNSLQTLLYVFGASVRDFDTCDSR